MTQKKRTSSNVLFCNNSIIIINLAPTSISPDWRSQMHPKTTNSHRHIQQTTNSHGRIQQATNSHRHIQQATNSHGRIQQATNSHRHIQQITNNKHQALPTRLFLVTYHIILSICFLILFRLRYRNSIGIGNVALCHGCKFGIGERADKLIVQFIGLVHIAG